MNKIFLPLIKKVRFSSRNPSTKVRQTRDYSSANDIHEFLLHICGVKSSAKCNMLAVAAAVDLSSCSSPVTCMLRDVLTQKQPLRSNNHVLHMVSIYLSTQASLHARSRKNS